MFSAELTRLRVLIVDDQPTNVALLRDILAAAGFTDVMATENPTCVLPMICERRPDLLLLDWHMPIMDGLAVLKELSFLLEQKNRFPVLVLTADITSGVRRTALAAGANDFVTKPFDVTEVLLRIRSLLETRLLHLQLAEHAVKLTASLRERSEEVERTQLEILRRLALAADYRDDNTGEHSRRVGQLAMRLARAAGMGEAEVDLLGTAAPLHDVGKIGIADHVLLKPGKLTDAEFEHIKTHATIGARLLSEIGHPVVKLAAEIALYHHERWDGAGYMGLKGEAIPIAARLVTVADVFDVLTHERPYKSAWSETAALKEIRAQSGAQFDPRLARLLEDVLECPLADEMPGLRRLGRHISPHEPNRTGVASEPAAVLPIRG